MPELAGVEGLRRVLVEAAGRRIRGVEVRDAGVLRNTSLALVPPEAKRHLHDRIVVTLDRGELRYRDQQQAAGRVAGTGRVRGAPRGG